MEGSYFMGRGKTLAQFPLLKDEKLRGSLVYYDGEQTSRFASGKLARARSILTFFGNLAILQDNTTTRE